jgi:hypothetical protein
VSQSDRASVSAKLLYFHLLNDPDIVHAFYASREGGDLATEPLKLLMVGSDRTPVGVVPLYFGACKELPYAVVIIGLAEEEYPELLAGNVKLPEGWDHRVEVVRDGA